MTIWKEQQHSLKRFRIPTGCGLLTSLITKRSVYVKLTKCSTLSHLPFHNISTYLKKSVFRQKKEMANRLIILLLHRHLIKEFQLYEGHRILGDSTIVADDLNKCKAVN